MDPAIFSVSITHLFLGFITGLAVSSVVWYPVQNVKIEQLLQEAIDKLFEKDLKIDELNTEIHELKNEIEKLQRDSETVDDIRHLIDRLYDNGYETAEEEEEEVEPNLPPPPPAIRSSHRCESCGLQTPVPGSTY
jgi:hypothetical protein